MSAFMENDREEMQKRPWGRVFLLLHDNNLPTDDAYKLLQELIDLREEIVALSERYIALQEELKERLSKNYNQYL